MTRLLFVAALLLAYDGQHAHAFVPVAPAPSQAFSQPLFAQKPNKKGGGSSSSISSSGGGGAGGGFGTTRAASSDGKVRSVSGHAGSGEKPLRQAAVTFDAIRKECGVGGRECTSDVYCRSPLNDVETFWFVGKVAVRPGTAATARQAVLSQKRLILEYSKRELRPQNLGGKFSAELELWLAPGDSEMDAVQNKVSLEKVEGSTVDLLPDFSVKDVGYNPEIYVGDEKQLGGLRIKRGLDGKPLKPVFDVNQSL